MTTKLTLAVDHLLVRGEGRKAVTTALLKAGPFKIGSLTIGGRWNSEQVLNEVKKSKGQRVKKINEQAEVLLKSLVG